MCISVELEDVFDSAEKIAVYNDGIVKEYRAGEPAFDIILSGWKDMVDGAHDLPAFGVSLNSYTVEEMKKGTWVEFYFADKYESNGMPYERLLINVRESYHGFNLIRYNTQSGYDGRCFYYDLLDKDMSDFYDIIVKI